MLEWEDEGVVKGACYALLFLGTLGGCIDGVQRVRCAAHQECFRDHRFGQCIQGFCAFEDADCPSGLRYDRSAAPELTGTCTVVEEVMELNACGGTTVFEAQPDAPCGVCSSGVYVCKGAETLECQGEFPFQVFTDPLELSASDELDSESEVGNVADGSLETSWFSAAQQAVVTWTNEGEQCVHSFSLNGNDFTDNYREGFGFEHVSVRSFDAQGDVTFEAEQDWPNGKGTIMFEPGGVNSVRVELTFQAPQTPGRAGFSELNMIVLDREL